MERYIAGEGANGEPRGDRPPAATESRPRYTAEYDPARVSDELVSRFDRDGYIVIENAVDAETIDRVRRAADRIVAEGREPGRWWGKPETAPRRVEYRGILNLDEAFMELLAPSAVFPLVVKILGANLHMMSSQIIYQNTHQPPLQMVRGGWHRDVIGTSEDLGYDATPRLALRAGYYLSDISEPGSGATLFAPGSHLLKKPIEVDPGTNNPTAFDRPRVKPGDAVIWENRTFHAPERNTSGNVRKAVMIQYGYRWLRPVDYLSHRADLLARCDPVTRQLLDSTDLNEDGSMTRMKGSRALLEWVATHQPNGVTPRPAADAPGDLQDRTIRRDPFGSGLATPGKAESFLSPVPESLPRRRKESRW